MFPDEVVPPDHIITVPEKGHSGSETDQGLPSESPALSESLNAGRAGSEFSQRTIPDAGNLSINSLIFSLYML
jgi:hypothetical protein